MPYPLTGRSTVRSIYLSSHPLGVECQACGHRALTFKEVDR